MWALRHADQGILFFLNHLGADGAARDAVIRVLASGTPYALFGILIYLGARKPRGGQALVFALFSAALAVGIGKILNQVVVRARPFVVFPDDVRHIDLIVRPDSFPSIHAVAVFGLACAVLIAYSWRWGVVMVALAALMGCARVAAGVHWPSDIAGGALIGLAAAAVMTALQRRWWPRLGLGKEDAGAREATVSAAAHAAPERRGLGAGRATRLNADDSAPDQ